MSTQSRRVPQALGDVCNRIYLTLVADADENGLVAQSSWQKIMDYADIQKKDEAEILVELLEKNKLISILTPGTRTKSPHFRIIGDFGQDVEPARRFYANNMARVNGLKNERSMRVLKVQQRNNESKPAVTEISIEAIKELEAPQNPTKPMRQWRFSVRIPGYGLIRNCFARTYQRRAAFIAGPSIPVSDRWMDIVEFEPHIIDMIRSQLMRAIATYTADANDEVAHSI